MKIRGQKSWPKRLAAIALGLAAAVLLVEAILRLAGGAAEVRLWHDVTADTGPFDFRIVCVGDSHTEGTCASPGLDYPSQLRAMLRARDPARRYRVANLGRSGSNSSEAVERVQKYLATVPEAPDLVIFQAGHNNDHNFRHAGFFAGADREGDRRQWARYFLAESRAWRLSFITRQRLRRIAGGDHDAADADSFFNIRGQAEQELLRDWLLSDLRGLRLLVEARGARLVLLNYFAPVTWVDDAYTRIQRDDGVAFIDIEYFGLNPVSAWSRRGELTCADHHPSDQGYSLIAEIVLRGLLSKGLLPESNRGLPAPP